MTMSLTGAPSFGGTRAARFGNLPQQPQPAPAAAATLPAAQFGHEGPDTVHFGMKASTAGKIALVPVAVGAALALTSCAQGDDTSTQAQGQGGDAVAVQKTDEASPQSSPTAGKFDANSAKSLAEHCSAPHPTAIAPLAEQVKAAFTANKTPGDITQIGLLGKDVTDHGKDVAATLFACADDISNGKGQADWHQGALVGVSLEKIPSGDAVRVMPGADGQYVLRIDPDRITASASAWQDAVGKATAIFKA